MAKFPKSTIVIIIDKADKANSFIKKYNLTDMYGFNRHQSFESPIIDLIFELCKSLKGQDCISKNYICNPDKIKGKKQFAKDYTNLQLFEFIDRLLPTFEELSEYEMFFDSLEELFRKII